MTSEPCHDCGTAEVRVHLGDVPLCDRCADIRIALYTRLAELPAPPAPMTVRDGEGRTRSFRFRLWRAPTGVEAELEETGVPVGEGYQRSVLGSHDCDVEALIARLRELALEEIDHRFLEPNPHREGWILIDDCAEGQLIWNDEQQIGTPYNVVIDGRTLSWEELGRTLEPYEGWRFRIEIADRIEDVRTHAAVIPFSTRDEEDSAPAE
jgi:hypothetical protein